jgi:hypothetical protein
MIKLLVLNILLFSSPVALSSAFIEINSLSVEERPIKIGCDERIFQVMRSTLNGIPLSPFESSQLEEDIAHIVLSVNEVEISFPDALKKRLIQFLKENPTEIDCSKFCSYLLEIPGAVEDSEEFSIGMVRDPLGSQFRPGDIISIGVTEEDNYSSRHYALSLYSNVFISKLGNYPGLCFSTLPSLISIYTRQSEKIRIYRFRKNI